MGFRRRLRCLPATASNEAERQRVIGLMRSIQKLVGWVGVGLGAVTGCSGSEADAPPAPEDRELTHGKSAAPNYERVFPAQRVIELNLRIGAEDWQAMLDDMAGMAGEFGADEGRPMPSPGLMIPPEAAEACVGLTRDAACTVERGTERITGTCRELANIPSLVCVPEKLGPTIGLASGGPGDGPALDDDAEFLEHTPIWRPCTVEYEGLTWNHVGVRFKGNSTLTGTWRSGSYKLPLRLSFDHFEDAAPEARDQRFFGFQKLSLTNNFSDHTFTHELLASELLRQAAVPAARAVLARVNVDTGTGPTYFGLYTLVELPDRPLLDAQLGGAGGNLYKPQGKGARLSEFVQESFQKETNRGEADFSDVQALIEALNSDRSDPAAWRENLERSLNVPEFLRWLAANTILSNWDVYGAIPHNYYLYGSPSEGGRLRWIPWDHDLAFGHGLVGSLFHDSVSSDWPLIRYLLDDPEYRRIYAVHARAFLEGPFAKTQLERRIDELHELIEPHVVGEHGELPRYTSLSEREDLDRAFYGGGGLVQCVDESREQALSAIAREAQ